MPKKLNENKEWSQIGIPLVYHPISIDDYTGDPDALKNVKKYIKNIKIMRREGLGLYLFGANGRGKTFLSCEILKEAHRRNYGAQFSTLNGVMRKFREGWNNLEAREDFNKYIREIEFLVIDEVGKEYRDKNGIVDSCFDDLLRYRINARTPTIITSNGDPETLYDIYGQSFQSLIKERMVGFEVKGEDYRDKIQGELMDKFHEDKW